MRSGVIVRQLQDEGVQPIFERLEETWQVDLCLELGVTLLQGYALARPQIAPTTFNAEFPEMLLPPSSSSAPPVSGPDIEAAAPLSLSRNDGPARPARVFGKRR